ncbi:MAG: SDR family oxidoreductase [Holophagales bacterium]|nr:SDR family oxidoreductase [Holophagales bacterium]
MATRRRAPETEERRSSPALPASGPDRFLVTGAASGIGRRLVGDLLERGHRVLASDLRLAELEACAAEDGWGEHALLLELDVRDPTAWAECVAAAVDAWGGLDVVMNVAGYLRPARVADCRDEDVHRHFDVNTKGVVFGTRAAARQMLEQGHGHIVNIASLASMAPVPGLGLYVGTKYAVRGFSMAAAQELAPLGIAVTTVCPDAVRTPMLDLQVDYPEAAITFTAPRFLTPGDISRLVLGKVLRARPVLVSIPRSRAFLARLADLFPSVASRLSRLLEGQGRKVQERMKQR